MSEPRTLDEMFSIAELQRDVADLRTEVTHLRAEVAQQTTSNKELVAATKELVDAWKAAGSLVRFVKWASTFVGALGILWAGARYVLGWGA